MPVETRKTCVLYTTAVCNLKCSYCYIDKNPALAEIDKILDESFADNDYYINFMKEMFPNPNQLQRIETWGGEPYLRMDRAHNIFRQALQYYPNLSEFFSSSNMAFEGWVDNFFALMDVFGEFAPRQITYDLQMSLDGPEDINDTGRGKGTTEKFLKNFHSLISQLETRLPANVNLSLHFKPTLSIETLRKLRTKADIVRYYKIFDDLNDEIIKLGFSNVGCMITVPNMAVPCCATKEDGEYFARFCSICRSIEMERPRVFKHYHHITPFSNEDMYDMHPTSLVSCGFTCGTGRTILGLLPNNMVSTCHNGFVDMISDYKRMSEENKDSILDARFFLSKGEHNMVFPKSEYHKYEDVLNCYYCENTTARFSSMVSQLVTLAYAGMVSSEFKDQNKAREAVSYFQTNSAYCIRDNHAISGSYTCVHNGLFKLLFNGAEKYTMLHEKNFTYDSVELQKGD